MLDFGAAGDGKADDTDALQDALDCAMRLGTMTDNPLSDGKVVYLPPGD
ncbi:glycosyl hydrolase family 28-related protein [Kitasatospora purpeofusca]